MLIKSSDNKREFYRIYLVHKLKCELALEIINDKSVNKPIGCVSVVDISAGGLSFRSQFKLPPTSNIIYSCKIMLKNKIHTLNGKILRMEKGQGYYHYGVEFNISNAYQESLLADMHHLSVYNKKGIRAKESYEYFSSN